jgi:FixJ family two-component response regulator
VKSAAICIAIVDDEASVRTMLRRLLRLADYEVVAFACGDEFMASLAKRRPDCIILDIHMPGLSGLELKSRMCAAHIDIPVVFITASDDLALDGKVQQAGGVALLRKPFSNDELQNAVGAALSRRSGEVS